MGMGISTVLKEKMIPEFKRQINSLENGQFKTQINTLENGQFKRQMNSLENGELMPVFLVKFDFELPPPIHFHFTFKTLCLGEKS